MMMTMMFLLVVCVGLVIAAWWAYDAMLMDGHPPEEAHDHRREDSQSCD